MACAERCGRMSMGSYGVQERPRRQRDSTVYLHQYALEAQLWHSDIDIAAGVSLFSESTVRVAVLSMSAPPFRCGGNEIGYVSKLTRQLIKPTEEFEEKTEIVFMNVRTST